MEKKAIAFLRKKGLIKKGNNKFLIQLGNDIFSLSELMVEFTETQLPKKKK